MRRRPAQRRPKRTRTNEKRRRVAVKARHPLRSRPVFLAAAAGSALALTAVASGQISYSWAAAGNGNWNDGSKWTPTGFPTGVDSATISVAGTYTVLVPNNTNQATSNLTIGNA